MNDVQKVSKADHQLIFAISKRASDLAIRFGVIAPPFEFAMDLTAVHARTPLRLSELLEADDGNFGHDVFGIRRHLDRETRELGDHFTPRFAQP